MQTGPSKLLHDTVQAYKMARSRASVAKYQEGALIHDAIVEARVAGLSIPQACKLLDLRRRDVLRHWRPDHRCQAPWPDWGDECEYLACDLAIWAHAPEHVAPKSPFTWTKDRVELAEMGVLGTAVNVDSLAARILSYLHPQTERTPEVLAVARQAVLEDLLGAAAILSDDYDGMNAMREIDLRTRRARGYYLGRGPRG